MSLHEGTRSGIKGCRRAGEVYIDLVDETDDLNGPTTHISTSRGCRRKWKVRCSSDSPSILVWYEVRYLLHVITIRIDDIVEALWIVSLTISSKAICKSFLMALCNLP